MSNIVRTRGDTYAEIVYVTDTDGSPMDITNYTFKLTVDPQRNPTDATSNLFTINGTITDAVGGVVEFVPTADQADQEPDTYWYDIQMTDDAQRIRTIAKARWKIIQDITK